MDTTQPTMSQIPAIDFSPYVPLHLIVNGVLDPDIVRSMRGWPRARWIIAEDAADLDATTQAELLAVLRGGAACDQRFLLVTADPAALTAALAADTPPNVGVLAHVTTQAEADVRLPGLLGCPTALRGVLVRPPAEPIDLSVWLHGPAHIDWVIAAGVTLPVATRRFEDLRRQCAAAGVPFFFDGWGSWVCISELYPDEDRDAAQSSAWYGAAGDPNDLPTLAFQLGPQFRPTLNDKFYRQAPASWGVPRQRVNALFVVGQTYTTGAIAAYIRAIPFADPSAIDEDRAETETLIVQTMSGGRLATFTAAAAQAWRCAAIGDALPPWATKLH